MGSRKIFGDFATNSLFVWTQPTDTPFKGFQEGRRFLPTLKRNDIEALKSEYVKEIKFLAPRNQTNTFSWFIILKQAIFKVSGDYPVLDQIQKKKLIYGRFLNQNDILSNSKSCTVISEDMYKQLFDKRRNAHWSNTSKLNSINYKVIGVYGSY